MQAGSSANIIPNEAVIQLNIRTLNDRVRETVLSAVKRIINAEAAASGAPKPPEIVTLPGEFPLTVNDEEATRKVAEALRQRLGAGRVGPTGPASASEDVSVITRAWKVPLVYWAVGGVDPQQYAKAEKAGRLDQISSNHSPEYAPVINPTLRVGVEAMLAAAGAWLAPLGAKP